MVGELVKLPVRVGTRVTRLWFRAIEETVSLGVGATGHVIELLASRSANGTGVETPPRQSAQPARPPSPAQPRAPRTRSPAQPPAPKAPSPAQPPAPSPSAPIERAPITPVPADTEPVHVSEEPVVVEEFAEPGAEQGAGAEIRVDPPWDGYERMTAKQVITRLATADPAALAAVQLYESTNRNRQSVINAVSRAQRGGSR